MNATAVTPVKFEPLIVTEVPTVPEPGEKDETVGQLVEATVKFVELLADPSGCVTAMGPVDALAGTVAVIWVEELVTNVDEIPLKVTAVTPLKPVPEMTTWQPGGPLVGAKPEIEGAALARSAQPARIATESMTVTTAPSRPLRRVSLTVRHSGRGGVIGASPASVSYSMCGGTRKGRSIPWVSSGAGSYLCLSTEACTSAD